MRYCSSPRASRSRGPMFTMLGWCGWPDKATITSRWFLLETSMRTYRRRILPTFAPFTPLPVRSVAAKAVMIEGPTPNDSDVAALVGAIAQRLNPRDTWQPFAGYPRSLALCVLDAIWSTNVRYRVTRG